MPMPGRDNGTNSYRYAYQGQEKDIETGKEAFELRLWDSRIGRWLTTDPMGEFHSPYLGMGNNPISKVDPTGGVTEDPPADSSGFEDGHFWLDKDGFWEYNAESNVWKGKLGSDDIYGSSTQLGAVYLNTTYQAELADYRAYQFTLHKDQWMREFYAGMNRQRMGAMKIIAGAVSAVLTMGDAAALYVAVDGLSSAVATTTLYRGVNASGGVAYKNALKGVVKPRGGIFGHTNALRHNTGLNGTVNSRLTSWTTDIDVALNYAFQTNGKGVVLKIKVPNTQLIKSANLHKINLFHRPGTVVSESEWLLKGSFSNIKNWTVKF